VNAAVPGDAVAGIGCPRCAATMQPLVLTSHRLDQPELSVDHCPDCRLVWFDRFESVQLDGRGWVRLLRRMQEGAGRPLAPATMPRLRCPTCAGVLKPVRNLSRYGLFAVLECPRGHGHLHSHSGLLAERGLVRPLGLAERRALAQERHALLCLNCGGPAGAGDDACNWCGTPLVVIDLPRLAHSLKPPQLSAEASPRGLGQHSAWACRGCGAPLDPGRETACARCGHLVVAHELPDILPLLDAAEADLAAAHAATARLHARLTTARPLPPAPDRPAPASSRARSIMLGGWLPLLLLLAVAGALALAVVFDLHASRSGRQDSIRARPVGTDPASMWAAAALLEPDEVLRQNLLSLTLRQRVGTLSRDVATLTFGELSEQRPGWIETRPWPAALKSDLRPVAPDGSEQLRTDQAEAHLAFSQAAPGLWIERDQRSLGIWALTLQNHGPLTLPAHRLRIAAQLGGGARVPWLCDPGPGAAPLGPGQRWLMRCETQVAPQWQAESWQALAQALQQGDPPELSFDDRLDPQTANAVIDALLADAVRAPAGAVRSPPWRWSTTAPQRQAALVLAALAGAFVLFCALGRWLGARRAGHVAVLLALPLCWMAGRGEGAASVLIIAMYVAMAGGVAFVFGFAYRFYRDTVFSRFGD
jgi:hypothetical protein